jgi:hypothetical protein
VRGYHRALASAIENSPEGTDPLDQAHHIREELERFEKSGQYKRAVERVRELQTEEVKRDLYKVRLLLQIKEGGPLLRP